MSFLPARASGLTLLGSALSVLVMACAVWAPDVTVLVAGVNVLVLTLALFTGGPREKKMGSQDESNDSVSEHYAILEKISEGGMGEVFRARQIELGRMVALKRIKDLRLTAEDRARFKREARVLSGLFNPHTINVFDAGIQNDRTLFYVMELLDGLDLRTLVERFGPSEPARVIHILRQATMSLLEAHQQGLVHRDLKPANLMVCRYGGEFDFVKVLDFGLVKGGHIDDDSYDVITRAGELPGTPAFLAPETVSGRAHVDARADFYALGAVGYYLLTGSYLFKADSPLAMVRAQLHEEPPRASDGSPWEVPEDLDELIAMCILKDPNERPQTATDLLERLELLAMKYPWTRAQAAEFWEKVPPASERPELIAFPSDTTHPRPSPVQG